MKNKMITLLIATVLFLSVLSIPLGTNHASAASKEGIVTASTLNVREKASTSSKTIGSVKKGQVVTIAKQQSSWSQIKYGSKYGWVSSTYINEIGYVTASSLNLRKSNSTSSQSLAILKKGTSVQIKSTKGSWLNIYVPSNKKTGWVSTKYISTTKIATVTTAAVTTKYYVTTSSLNIRKSATTSSKVVATVKKGASVTYYSKSGNWAKVKTASGVTGWASMTYLSKTKPVVTKTYYVTTDSLNVRSSGSTKAKVVTAIKKGASVTYYSQSNNWGKIKTSSGVTGYVSMKYLSTTKPKTVKEKPELNVKPVSNDDVHYVISDTLNIRESGDANADLVDIALRGDALTLTEIDGDWGKVVTEDGLIGWVNLTYLSSTEPTTGLEGKVIVLDPGHGAQDPGAVGKNSKEKDLTLSTAKKVKAKLEAAGAEVVMTRTGDTYPTLSERVKISQNNNADVFISIHYNAGSTSANGIETYYWTTYEDESKLAGFVQKELIKSTGLNDRKVKKGNFQVIRTNNGSAILVELGFITNPNEEKIIKTSDFQNDAATGIVNGLEAYFESL